MKQTTRFLALLLSLVLLVSCGEGANTGNGGTDGVTDEDLYKIVTPETMPEIHITTEDGDNSWATRYDREDKLAGLIEYTDARISVKACDAAYALTEEEAEVKVRGNYTLDYDKKPIRIKFKKKNGMLGMNEGEAYKNWVLLADWKDPSMTRNALTFYLGNAILGQDGYYASDFRVVEVYLNGAYWGVYLLAEQQEAKEGRASAPEVEKGYTGTDIGYFFEFDGYYMYEKNSPDGDPTLEMRYGGGRNGLRGYTVKSDINSDEQLAFLKNYLDCVYLLINRANYQRLYYKFNEDKTAILLDGECKSAKDAVCAVIDIDSLVDTYILNELACDLDLDFSSFYFSLDMTEGGKQKLVFEAPWDFDSAYGIWRGICNDAEGMYAMERGNPWFELFDGVAWFEELVEEKWAKLKAQGVLDTAASLITRLESQYGQNYIKNNDRWEKRLTEGHGSLIPELETFNDSTRAQALASAQLAAWFDRRVAYLDGVWSKK